MSKTKDEEKQLELGLKEPISNRFWKYRARLSKRFERFENYRIIKQTTVWLLFALAFFLNALIYDYYLDIEKTLPSVVPFLNNYIQLAPRLVKMEQIQYIPIFSFITSIIVIFVSIRIFNRKPYYSILLLMVLSVSLSGILINLVNLANQYI